MPGKAGTNTLDADNLCDECGRRHVVVRRRRSTGAEYELPSCAGHVTHDRDGYVPGQQRPLLDEPRPCGAVRRKDAPNTWRCHMHGGRAQQVKQAQQRRRQEREARTMLDEALRKAYGDNVPEIPAAEAMIRAVSWTYAEVVFLRAKVAELREDELAWGITRETEGDVVVGHGTSATLDKAEGQVREAKPSVWWTMLRDSKRDLVQFSAAARAAGCDEARVRLAESQGQQVAEVMRRTADAILTALIAAGMTADLAAVFRTVFAEAAPAQLRLLVS